MDAFETWMDDQRRCQYPNRLSALVLRVAANAGLEFKLTDAIIFASQHKFASGMTTLIGNRSSLSESGFTTHPSLFDLHCKHDLRSTEPPSCARVANRDWATQFPNDAPLVSLE